MKISLYNAKDLEEIEQLYIDVFTASENETEGQTVGLIAYKLMTDTVDGNVYAFTAVEDDVIIGCVFFSKLTFSNNRTSYMLSPMAIKTSEQKKGLGQKLISYGLNELKNIGVETVLTYGDPSFYSKVGFAAVSVEVIPPPFKLSFSDGWLVNSLSTKELETITGKSGCVKAFNNADLW